MINDELERWRQHKEWLDDIDIKLVTMLEDEEVYTSRQRIIQARDLLTELWAQYHLRIESRETLKAQLQGSLSQATDGGKDD